METLVQDEATQNEPIVINQADNRMPLSGFLIRAVAFVVLLAAAALVVVALMPNKTVVVTNNTSAATPGGKGALIGDTVEYKWTQIVGPGNVRIYTQCSTTEPHTRVFVSNTGVMDWRPDLNCK